MPQDRRLHDFLSSVPDPGQTAAEHLAHTLACFKHLPGVVLLPGIDVNMLTLRNLHNPEARQRLRAALADCDGPEEEFVLTATSGVYAETTGLTRKDLRELSLEP